jgi:hypothetical protein
MRVVPMIATPLSAEHARDALLAAMPHLDRETALLVLALVWVETGHGGSCKNNNPGNITASSGYDGDAWRPPWFLDSDDPHLHALHVRMLGGSAPSAFRSYDTAQQGFNDFAVQLVRRFSGLLRAGATGDAATFVRAIRETGYSPDVTPAHIGTFTSLQHELAPLVAHLPGGSGGSDVLGVAATLGALYLAWRYLKGRRRHGAS